LNSKFVNETIEDDNKNFISPYYDGDLYRTISKKPFSLIRRIQELKKNGFSNFMVDLRNKIVNKRELNKIINYLKNPESLKDYIIFNYKKGIK
jgi:hypothetical protein